jgi:hypothetical protein
MPQLIRPGDVQVITKEGECLVNIQMELTIKLDGSNLSIAGVSAQAKQAQAEEEKVDWQIPDFGSNQKLKFGKES